MTLRVNYNEIFRTWDVQYLNTWTGSWHTCNEYYKGRDTYAAFRSEEEAIEFMDWKYAKYRTSNEHFINLTPCVVPDDYYGVPGRYYGD